MSANSPSTLRRFADNPLVRPEDVPFGAASGAFNPAATVDPRTGKIVLLVRVFDRDTKRSSLAMAISSDGEHVDEIRSAPALAPEAPYEEWGVEDARVTFLADEGRFAITYTGYSRVGPRVCLVTTEDILDPSTYRRHGPRIDADDKNCVVFPHKVGGRYVILHRPMPRIVLAEVERLEDPWPTGGTPLLSPAADTWRSSRVGAGAPPVLTRAGWLLAYHGATSIEEGNVYAMGWCLLDAGEPTRVLAQPAEPALAPSTSYEVHELARGALPQVDMNNFRGGVRVVFPEGLVRKGGDLLVYYGAADVNVGGARVDEDALLSTLAATGGAGVA